jgi:hypothetical protein
MAFALPFIIAVRAAAEAKGVTQSGVDAPADQQASPELVRRGCKVNYSTSKRPPPCLIKRVDGLSDHVANSVAQIRARLLLGQPITREMTAAAAAGMKRSDMPFQRTMRLTVPLCLNCGAATITKCRR